MTRRIARLVLRCYLHLHDQLSIQLTFGCDDHLFLNRCAFKFTRDSPLRGGSGLLAVSWKDPSPVEVDPESLPHVLLQLPLYNEAQVVGRLIDTVAELSYPRDRLTIQVLDDSTDETVGIAVEHVRRAQERGVDIHHVRRPSREGFKAGALAYGMELNDASFIAILDADFLPQADFIEQLILNSETIRLVRFRLAGDISTARSLF